MEVVKERKLFPVLDSAYQGSDYNEMLCRSRFLLLRERHHHLLLLEFVRFSIYCYSYCKQDSPAVIWMPTPGLLDILLNKG